MRRNVAASMKPAPSATKYFRYISFQCLRATTTSPPTMLASAASRPRPRLHANGAALSLKPGCSGGDEVVGLLAAERQQLHHHLAHDVVGGRGPGGEAERQRPGGQPRLRAR